MRQSRAFTLLELMTAVLLGSLIMLMIAGGLNSAIRAWEAVGNRVSINYNRRSVTDLIKRQTSSLFFRADADELDRAANNVGGARRPVTPAQRNLKDATGRPAQPVTRNQSSGFHLPDGAHFFSGNIQELNFLSTVSFLSDFPGQVAVRYFVVKGEPGEGESLGDLENSRSAYTEDMDDDVAGRNMDFSFEEGEVMDELEGDLYLYIEEKNLFVTTTMEDAFEDDNADDPFANTNRGGEGDNNANPNDRNDTGRTGGGGFGDDIDNARDMESGGGFGTFGTEDDLGEIVATNRIKLLGPMRKFTIRYRRPGMTQVQDADDDERWAETWDVDRMGGYPSAIEFTLIYEPGGENGADIPTEDLDGIRMVIPVYSTQNLVRGAGALGGNQGGGLIND